MNRDLMNAMRLLESLWSFPDGPMALLRRGRISDEAVEQVVLALESLELPPDARELDRLMVALLWNIPLFVEYQKEAVLENGGDELLYQRLRGRAFEEVERLLGLGHVDHDVGQWFGNEP